MARKKKENEIQPPPTENEETPVIVADTTAIVPVEYVQSATVVDSVHFGGNKEPLAALYAERKRSGYRLDHSVTMQMGPQCQVLLFWERA